MEMTLITKEVRRGIAKPGGLVRQGAPDPMPDASRVFANVSNRFEVVL